MTKPFLLMAAFCEQVSFDDQNRLCIRGVFDTSSAESASDLTMIRRTIPTVVAVHPAGQKGRHTLKVRFVDANNMYLPGEGVTSYDLKGDETGVRMLGPSNLEMSPPRDTTLRLLIQWDNALIGWIPLKVQLLRTTKGES